MTMNELWARMESEIAGGKPDAAGWLIRLALPKAGCPLFAAVEVGSLRRAVLLRLPVASVPARRHWPRCRGLEPIALKLGSDEHFGVALKDERFRDVFSSLSEDLVRRVSEATTPAEQSSAFLGQLARWQKFLTSSSEGLSEEMQRGLWGELYFLRTHLLPTLGLSAVAGWKGAERAAQDFQFDAGAVEVKTTIAKQPQVVRISSERQLDHSVCRKLILHVLALEFRDGIGETLPELIASLRSVMQAHVLMKERLEDSLLLAGYVDAHVARYADRGYVVRSESSLHVTDGFPALTEQCLPVGVCEVSYGLAISACDAFLMSSSALKYTLADINSAPQQQG
jgi:hypothetical protein